MVLREVRHLWLSWLLNDLLMLLRTNIDVLLISSLFIILIILVLFLFLFEVVWVFVLDLLPQIFFWSKGWWSKVRLFGLLFHELLQSRLWLLETLVPHIWRTVQWSLLVVIILLGTLTIVWWYVRFLGAVDFRNDWWLRVPLYWWSTLSSSPYCILVVRHHSWLESALILLFFELDLIGIFIMPLAPHHVVGNSSIWKCFLWIFNHFHWLLIKVWLETVVLMILVFVILFQLALVLIIFLLVPINLVNTGWTYIWHILDLSIVQHSTSFVNLWMERRLFFLKHFIDFSLLLRWE